MKHWQKTVSIEKLLKAISGLEKGEWIVDTCHNVRIVHSCTHNNFGLGSSSALLPPGGTATIVADARGLLYQRSCTHTIRDNADRIKDSAKSWTKMFV
jgi:hypothetical protein